MAVRLFRKISSTFNPNLIQVFHPRSLGKSAVIGNTNNDQVEESTSKDEESQQTPLSDAKNIQPKVEPYNVREHSKLSFPDLQPSTLPDYYSPYKHSESPSTGIDNHVVEPKKSASQRIFEASSTYKNVKLPLKKPRLAKPFPDPVKIMESDTISDDEKSRQMQSDARYPGKSTSKNVNSSNFNPQNRSFATNPERKAKKSHKPKTTCKKPDKKICDRLNKYKNCPSVRLDCACNYEFKQCKKQIAPYPSYSELCHTVLDSYPTECQMCPWTPQNHPTFNPKKKEYHTSAVTFSPKKQDFEKWLHNVNQNRGRVQEKKILKNCKTNQDEGKLSKISKNTEIPISTNQFKLYRNENFSTKSKQKKSSNNIKDPITVQKLPSELNVSSKPYFLYAGTKIENDEIEVRNLKKNGKRRKNNEMFPIVKYNSKAKNVVYNPSKKEKQVDQDWKKEETPSTINITINYFMAKKKDRSMPPGARDKCPDLDPVGEDPCNLKRPGITRECPKDLLIKKRRPIKPPSKKKCFPINPPKPNNPDQQTF